MNTGTCLSGLVLTALLAVILGCENEKPNAGMPLPASPAKRVSTNPNALAKIDEGRRLWRKRQNLDGAAKLMREGLADLPDEKTAWNALGELYCVQGRDAEAMAAFQKGLRDGPDPYSPIPSCKYAQLCHEKGLLDLEYQTYVDLMKDNRVDKTIKVKRDPKNGVDNETRAMAHVLVMLYDILHGSASDVRREAMACMALRPKNFATCYHLSVALGAVGMLSEAHTYMKYVAASEKPSPVRTEARNSPLLVDRSRIVLPSKGGTLQ